MKRRTNIMALIQNKRARHDYAIDERFEAGLVLDGWEVKSVRAGRARRAPEVQCRLISHDKAIFSHPASPRHVNIVAYEMVTV